MIRKISTEVLDWFFFYLSIVPVSFSDIVVGAVVDDPNLIQHTLLSLFLIVQEHGIS